MFAGLISLWTIGSSCSSWAYCNALQSSPAISITFSQGNLDLDFKIEMMKNVTNLLDFDFIFSLSAGYPGSKEWVQFACDPLGIPMSTGCTSIQVTDIIPYVQNDQIKGILSGMPGAAEYEQLVQNALKERGMMVSPGKASINMAAQSMAHVIIVLLIILGNITYFLTRKSNKNGGME